MIFIDNFKDYGQVGAWDYVERNIEVFEDTRRYSQYFLHNATERLKQSTKVIIDGSIFLKDAVQKDQVVEVKHGDTVEFLHTHRGSKIAVLNFADAYEAGGLVLQGEPTFEEHLCRASNLYESLLTEDAQKNYYQYNDKIDSSAFSDRIIYSEGVTFFKDSNYKLTESMLCDVISSPAPLGNVATEEILIQRIKCIIGCAYKRGVEHLVLGAYGCGAFNCNPIMVATAFKKVLDDYRLFNEVTFIIKETPGRPDKNYQVFNEILGGNN